jgi:gluconokinase
VAQALAAQLGLDMVDGDDLHLPESVAKMRAGQALNDADRWPWLERIGQCLAQHVTPELPSRFGRSGRVMACSALKRSYRDRLRSLAPAVRVVFLDGDAELIRQRLSARLGHYMHAELLASQLQTLERPQPDEPDVLTLDLSLPVAELVRLAQAQLWPERVTA